MTKIKTSELKDEKLAYWAARAQEWELGWSSDFYGGFPIVNSWYSGDDEICKENDYRPDINGGQAMELQKKYGLDVRPHVIENGTIKSWSAGWTWSMKPKDGQIGESPEIAICRVVVASMYGEYVDDK